MATHKSAVKRNRQRVKRQLRNRNVLGSLRNALKKARAAVDTKAPGAEDLVKVAISTIDKAVTKGVLPRATASRLISRLQRRNAAA